MHVTEDGGLQWDQEETAEWRYRETTEILGRDAWGRLVSRVKPKAQDAEAPEAETPDAQVPENAWRQFVAEIALEEKEHEKPERVFVSHQRDDKEQAERLAGLATKAGLQYWLDIHDPWLKWAGSGEKITGPPRAILIAGIIEMALLNCKYIVAVHTEKSQHSKWIPYEFARVKHHRLKDDHAAGWFAPGVVDGDTAEYFELACKTYSGDVPPAVPPMPWNPWQLVDEWLKDRVAAASGA